MCRRAASGNHRNNSRSAALANVRGSRAGALSGEPWDAHPRCVPGVRHRFDAKGRPEATHASGVQGLDEARASRPRACREAASGTTVVIAESSY